MSDDKRNLEATPEERQALEAYSAMHPGRSWKRKLLDDWTNGRTTGVLQQIRNSRGPSWLVGDFDVKPKTPAPLSPDAQRLLNRIPSTWSSEPDVRKDIRTGLLLLNPAIAQILNGLERRGLIERGPWLESGRTIRRIPPPEVTR